MGMPDPLPQPPAQQPMVLAAWTVNVAWSVTLHAHHI